MLVPYLAPYFGGKSPESKNISLFYSRENLYFGGFPKIVPPFFPPMFINHPAPGVAPCLRKAPHFVQVPEDLPPGTSHRSPAAPRRGDSWGPAPSKVSPGESSGRTFLDPTLVIHKLVGGPGPPLWKIWVNWDDNWDDNRNPILMGK